MKERMTQLKAEVDGEIDSFVNTTSLLENETANRIKTLKKMKKKYKHL